MSGDMVESIAMMSASKSPFFLSRFSMLFFIFFVPGRLMNFIAKNSTRAM